MRRHSFLLMLMMMFVWGAAAQPALPFPICDPAAPISHGAPSASPDGHYSVFFECYDAQKTVYGVYAYNHLTDEEPYLLGTTPTDLSTSYIFVAQWLDETTVEIRSETGGGTYNDRSVYLADAATPDSLQEVARDYVSRPRFADNPPRYEWAVEDGIAQRFDVYLYDVTTREIRTLYSDDCLLRDELANALSCHMVTANTNASYTPDGEPTALLLNIGDSIREVKTIAIHSLPDGELRYQVDALGMGYGDWLAADTLAVFNLAFDFESIGFSGLFVRFDETGEILATEPFVLPNGEPLTQRPAWLAEVTPPTPTATPNG